MGVMKAEEICWNVFQEDWNMRNPKETVDNWIVIAGTQKLKKKLFNKRFYSNVWNPKVNADYYNNRRCSKV